MSLLDRDDKILKVFERVYNNSFAKLSNKCQKDFFNPCANFWNSCFCKTFLAFLVKTQLMLDFSNRIYMQCGVVYTTLEKKEKIELM